MEEKDIIHLIREHQQEFTLDDIRTSLVDFGYTYDEADQLINMALYSNAGKRSSWSQTAGTIGGTALLAGALISGIALLRDLPGRFKNSDSPSVAMASPKTPAQIVREAADAYERGNYEKAVSLLQPAAQEGNPEAQYLLGSIYDMGNGLQYDHAQAARWYRQAALQGNSKAQYLLGMMHLKGRGVPEDGGEAAKWLRKAAKGGSAEAQVELARMHELGIAVAPSYIQAARWYRKAAERGNPEAQASLCILYSNGNGVPQDFDQAAKWCLNAARQGDMKSQAVMGVLYSMGQGVARDVVESYKWFLTASANGNPSAKEELKRLEQEMTEGQIHVARERAAQYLEPAEEFHSF